MKIRATFAQVKACDFMNEAPETLRGYLSAKTTLPQKSSPRPLEFERPKPFSQK